MEPFMSDLSVRPALISVYLAMFTAQQITYSRNRIINERWVWKYVEGSGRGIFQVLRVLQHFPGGTEDYEEPQFTVGLWAEIWNPDLPNGKKDRHPSDSNTE
jgi:hypothetical protein